MTHYFRHLSSITLNSPCEKENQTLESFVDFLQRNRTELYCIFPASFQRAAVLNKENWAFNRAFENIEPQNAKNAAEIRAEKECFTFI